MKKTPRRILPFLILCLALAALSPAALRGEALPVLERNAPAETLFPALYADGAARDGDASARFHAAVTSSKDTYAAGTTAIYAVKYTLDPGSVHGGDFVLFSVPTDVASAVDLSVSGQHFAEVVPMGGGVYKLIFAEGAETAVSGSFTAFITTADAAAETTGQVKAGDASADLTVAPRGPAGTGVYTDTIMKDASDNGDAVGYGDYDYSEGVGDFAAQIGILKRNPGSLLYRLYINDKQGELSDITVTDVLPDGMIFDPEKPAEVYDRVSGDAIDPSLFTLTLDGNTLTFRYPGTLRDTLEIHYWVKLTSDDCLKSKYTNRADIVYTENGTPYVEHRNYVLQGSDYSAANGEKSVDKTEISTAPEDQLVTYTIKFWNQNGFAAGEISLDDVLDDRVRFVTASPNPYFSVSRDEMDPRVIHMTNTKAISGSETVYVRFICDFSTVPAGGEVKNSVGGNTTATRKVGGAVTLRAAKYVDGEAAGEDQVFPFELLDEDGNVLQEKTNDGGSVVFDPIPLGKEDLGRTFHYRVREKEFSDPRYIRDGAVFTVTVKVADEADDTGLIPAEVSWRRLIEPAAEAAFYNTTPRLTISGEKIWADADDRDGLRPDEISLRLFGGGREIEVKRVTAADGWRWRFDGLPRYSAEGFEIAYSILEDEVTGYIAAYDGWNVINTHEPEKTNISGEKVWQDGNDQDGLRPESVVIHLLADGEEVGQKEVSAGDEWRYAFSNLDKFKSGKEITYTVTEDAVPGYETKIEGTRVINTHTPEETVETVAVTVSKQWDDDGNRDGLRPDSVTVRLLADGKEAAHADVTASAGWSRTFADLPKYAEDGREIVYTVTEDAVPGDTARYSGFDIVNEHVPETLTVPVRKIWVGDDENVRPDSVTVELLADGEPTGDVLTLSAENEWQGAFADLPLYNGGKAVAYTVAERSVSGYTALVTGSAAAGFTVTNTREAEIAPPLIDVSGEKRWNDADDRDGQRPDAITVYLLANGERIAERTVTAGDHWRWRFDALPVLDDDGREIAYSFAEEAVPGYTAAYDGSAVINTYTPGKTSVTVTKVWEDENDRDRLRPAAVEIRLLADGEATGDVLTLSAANEWRGVFAELPLYNEGKAVVYTVAETAAAGYETTVSGDAVSGFTVTNRHAPEPETVVVRGQKTWDDDGNRDGLRPDSVTVRLLADGKEAAHADVTAAADWRWAFEGLPKYGKDGTEIAYAVAEDPVPGYETKIEGTNVINTHVPEKTEIHGEKVWRDGNDQDGLRPDSVIIRLLADGEEVGQREVSAADGWRYAFTGLDKYSSGREILYTVKEDPVSGYTARYSGFDIVNERVPETLTIPVRKIWVGDDESSRPESVRVALLADGETTGDVLTLSAENEWQGAFSGLPRYKEGKAIAYTVAEEAVSGYTSTATGDAAAGFTVTNRRETAAPTEPEKPSATAEKTPDKTSGSVSGKTPDKTDDGTTGKGSAAPRTGDDASPLLWLFLAAASVGGIAVLAAKGAGRRPGE
ncbi:MAG: Cna B-type domain-containing protein [Bacillota bacterium]|jgi:hypothetical protein